MRKNLSFRYYLYQRDFYLVLFDRFYLKDIHRSIGFKDMYKFIKEKNIDYHDIYLKHLSYFSLFDWFVDESSLDSGINRGDRI